MRRFGYFAIAMMALSIQACTSKDDLARIQARESAKETALSLASVAVTGVQAEGRVRNIHKGLSDVKLTVADVPLEQSALDYLVKEAYSRDAQLSLRNLRGTHQFPDGAKHIKTEFEDQMQKSGRTILDFGTTNAELTSIVSLNALEFIQANGGKPTPADYKAAGLPVPTVVRTRTIIRRVPVKVAQARKPVPTKKPAARKRNEG